MTASGPTAQAAPVMPTTPAELGLAGRKLIAPRLGFALNAWAARYTSEDGEKPAFTWTGTLLDGGEWEASLVIEPEGEQRRTATWSMLTSPGSQPTSGELSYVARPRNAEARRLARLPLASPADAGPIKIVLRVLSPRDATTERFEGKPIGPEDAEIERLVVDADGKLDHDLLRGFSIIGEPAYPTEEIRLASSTRFKFKAEDYTFEEFQRYITTVSTGVVVAVTFEDEARRPKDLAELLFRPATEVRVLRASAS